MRQIRYKTFETNSSSTHSLVMCSDDEFKSFKRREVYYVEWLPSDFANKLSEQYKQAKFIPVAVADNILKELSNWDREDFLRTHDEFFDNERLERFEQSYLTPGGEKIIAFGVYGYDG